MFRPLDLLDRESTGLGLEFYEQESPDALGGRFAGEYQVGEAFIAGEGGSVVAFVVADREGVESFPPVEFCELEELFLEEFFRDLGRFHGCRLANHIPKTKRRNEWERKCRNSITLAPLEGGETLDTKD